MRPIIEDFVFLTYFGWSTFLSFLVVYALHTGIFSESNDVIRWAEIIILFIHGLVGLYLVTAYIVRRVWFCTSVKDD